jgi:predicted GIY-YIG superfamily endonuclease
MYYVYILRCSNGQLYTGCTDNLKERIERHQNGYVPATKSLLPIKLISYFAFTNKGLSNILRWFFNPIFALGVMQ